MRLSPKAGTRMVAVGLCSMLASCLPENGDTQNASDAKVAFLDGNEGVIKSYKRAPSDCGRAPSGASQSTTRIMVTYFGSFTQTSSGAPEENVTETLANFVQRSSAQGAAAVRYGAATPNELLIKRQLLTINGVNYDVCWVRGPVNYHSPPRFHKVAKGFRPALLVNTGQSSRTIIETSSANIIRTNTVYNNEGSQISISRAKHRNVSGRVVESDPSFDSADPDDRSEAGHTWRGDDLTDATNAAKGKARDANSYLCNATAYVFARAIDLPTGESLLYAGPAAGMEDAKSLRLGSLDGSIRHGFFHIAEGTSPREAYAKLRSLIACELQNECS